MHELSVCGAIADIATRRAGERHVTSVHVLIGELRQVVPDSLTFCWSMITAGTALDGSTLVLERVPARLHCRACSGECGLAGEISLACRACASLDVEVIAGDELVVTALDLVTAGSP